MSTLLRASSPVNSRLTAPSTVAAVAWHSLLKTADKEGVRDNLPAGTEHAIDLTVTGTVNGAAFSQHVRATLSVGHDSTRATSSTPAADRIIGAILAKLNEATREAILRDLPEQYAAAGCDLPEVPAAIADKAAAMLQRLRAKKSIPVRGSVSVQYALDSERKSVGRNRIAAG